MDLVLVGGGHAHVAVLKSFGMKPMPGVRVTLISERCTTAYSGMIPGYIAGHYSFASAHIELRALCHFAGARCYRSKVIGLDLAQRRVCCDNRPPPMYDILSIDTGSTPEISDVPGAREHAVPVKPIDRFAEAWQGWIERADPMPDRPLRVVVVGAGAGGVELILAMQYRLRQHMEARGTARGIQPRFHLVSGSAMPLPSHNPRVQAKFARILNERGVEMHFADPAVRVGSKVVHCKSGNAIACDFLVWATAAAAPAWVAQSGLATDSRGFISVNDCLQSLSHREVFAAGDIADVKNHPRPKSGVFAVRQGPPLTRNLRRALESRAMVPFVPQREFLSLISTGDKYAIASRGSFAMEGAWLWQLKDWIDRRWMRQYCALPDQTRGDKRTGYRDRAAEGRS
jgi:selenide,water dikinase